MAGKYSVKTIFGVVDRFTPALKKMRGRVGDFAKTAQRRLKTVDEGFSKVHGGIKKVGKAFLGFGVAAGAGLASVIKSGASFEQAITDVGAVSLKTRGEIKELEKQALDLGSTTKFTATEVANGMELMAKAGFTVEETMAGIPGVLHAAAAGGEELAAVSDVVSSTLKGLAMEASETGRVADVLALASSKTKSSILSLGESITNVAPTARELGVDFEELTAGVALLQDVGLDASTAGTALNTALTRLAKPSAKLEKQMAEMGVKFKDAEGNMLPFPEVLANISKAGDEAGGNMDKVAFLADLVGLRGQKAASNLAHLFETGKVEELTAELNNAEGAAKKMADLRMDTFEGDMLKLGASVDRVKTDIFNLETGPLRNVVQGMTEWVDKNRDAITSGIEEHVKWLKDNLPEIVTWLKRIGVALAVFYSLAAAVKAARVAIAVFTGVIKIAQGAVIAFTAIKKGLAAAYGIAKAAVLLFNIVAATNPFILIAMAIAAVVALVIAFWPEISAFFEQWWEDLKYLWGELKIFFTELWTGIVEWFKGAWDSVVNWFKDLWEGVSDWFGGLWEGIKDGFSGVLDGIIARVSRVTGLIKKAIDFARRFLGFGGGDEAEEGGGAAKGGGASAPVPSPQAATSHHTEERKTHDEMGITIRDESGRAEVTKKPRRLPQPRLAPSGA
jgi:TP901 family phage tail tape measure protein